MEVEDEQEQDVFFNEEDEPEVGHTETDTEVDDNEITADALYRKLSEFSTVILMMFIKHSLSNYVSWHSSATLNPTATVRR